MIDNDGIISDRTTNAHVTMNTIRTLEPYQTYFHYCRDVLNITAIIDQSFDIKQRDYRKLLTEFILTSQNLVVDGLIDDIENTITDIVMVQFELYRTYFRYCRDYLYTSHKIDFAFDTKHRSYEILLSTNKCISKHDVIDTLIIDIEKIITDITKEWTILRKKQERTIFIVLILVAVLVVVKKMIT